MHIIIHIPVIFVSGRYIRQLSRFLKIILIKLSPYCWGLKACKVLFYQAACTTIFRSDTKFLSNWVNVRRFHLGMLGMIQSKTLIFLYVKEKICKTFYIRILVIPKEVLIDIGIAPYETSVSHPTPTEFSILSRNMFMRKYRAFSLNIFIIRNSAFFVPPESLYALRLGCMGRLHFLCPTDF